MFPLSLFLKKLIKHGTLNIIDIKGKTHSFIGTDEPNITIHFHDNGLLWEIFLRPDLKAGEAYSRFKGWVGQINWPGKSKQNVAHHYDLSDDLYDLFLDKNRQYSTGYFLSENDKVNFKLKDYREVSKNMIASFLLVCLSMLAANNIKHISIKYIAA